MRTLLLLRHGKAVGSDPDGDHARALAERGHQQASTIGSLLDRLGIRPDLVLASDARRTRETAERALEGTGSSPRLEPQLYAAPAQAILAIIREQADDVRKLMIVGHNPGLGEAARLLEGPGEPQAAIALHEGFPTGALAVLEFDAAHWSDVEAGTGLLSRFIVPDRQAES